MSPFPLLLPKKIIEKLTLEAVSLTRETSIVFPGVRHHDLRESTVSISCMIGLALVFSRQRKLLSLADYV